MGGKILLLLGLWWGQKSAKPRNWSQCFKYLANRKIWAVISLTLGSKFRYFQKLLKTVSFNGFICPLSRRLKTSGNNYRFVVILHNPYEGCFTLTTSLNQKWVEIIALAITSNVMPGSKYSDYPMCLEIKVPTLFSYLLATYSFFFLFRSLLAI